ncbi:Glycosyltransferase involved in cell wall bisynthesis [Sphingomonas guangdongensis]|uniref:Glycosyltransferase involved in cell wall bisynthesis n=1 Tax=Sphingomonas guangdongensis TaxID=1141890 RepID=A0A285QGX7_9SPHN|nr:Glycosyltransferase involved in cell wall bisynthesis [Sphingomonas guangdongensis]
MSIVVPAYNAQDTLNATLTSLRNQTFERLEIFVVDDGSRDATAAVASSHAAADPRVRLIQQRNGGVARARNAGLAEAEGSYVAFVDADDLCAPERTSKMLAAMWRMGDDCALAYTWSTHIDGSGRIVAESQRSEHEGWVHDELCKINFVGNGSAALVRTDVARAVGGFDPTLREVGAQGCEDIDFYLRVARRHKFAVVREFLTGYRQSVSNMSSDGMQMYRSFRRVERRHGREVPAARAALKLGRKYVLGWLLSLASLHGRYRTYWKLVPRLALIAPRWAYNIVVTHRVTSPGEELPIVDDALLADSRNPDRGARFPIGGPVVTGASHV